MTSDTPRLRHRVARAITRSRNRAATRRPGPDGRPAPPPTAATRPIATTMPTALGLLIPARADLPCQVLPVPLTAAGISDAIGGGLLEESVNGDDPDSVHTVYQDADRDLKALPDNPRALRLAVRLEWSYLNDRNPLRGDTLVLGLNEHGQDTDVPEAILAAAVAEGLFPG